MRRRRRDAAAWPQARRVGSAVRSILRCEPAATVPLSPRAESAPLPRGRGREAVVAGCAGSRVNATPGGGPSLESATPLRHGRARLHSDLLALGLVPGVPGVPNVTATHSPSRDWMPATSAGMTELIDLVGGGAKLGGRNPLCHGRTRLHSDLLALGLVPGVPSVTAIHSPNRD